MNRSLLIFFVFLSQFLYSQEEEYSGTDSVFFIEATALSYEIDPDAEEFIIDDIVVRVFLPLGYDIYDTTKLDTAFIKRFGNRFVISTKDKVIRQHLLFEKNDTVRPLVLKESERLLRQSLVIRDARIISKKTGKKGHYIIEVLVQDRFPINAGFSKRDDLTIYTLKYLNVLGYGSNLNTDFALENNAYRFNTFNFEDRNVGNSYIHLRANYSTARSNYINELALNRRYASGLFKYGYGGGISQVDSEKFRYDEDSITASYESIMNRADVWFGRAINLNDKKGREFSNNLVINGRYYIKDEKIGNVNLIDSNVNVLNQSGNTFLMNFGFVKRKYFVDHYIYRFIYSEDLPVGFFLNGLVGRSFHQLSEDINYAGFNAGFAFKHRFGYMNGRVDYVRTMSNASSFNSSSTTYKLLYLSPLLIDNKFKNRFFVSTKFRRVGSDGFFNRLFLDNEDGFLNVNSQVLSGITKSSITFTNILYTPYKVLGFNVGVFVYAAFANLSALRSQLIEKPWYQAYGFGLLVRNENLVINELRFSFTFYPSFAESTFKLNPTWIYDLYLPDISIEMPEVEN